MSTRSRSLALTSALTATALLAGCGSTDAGAILRFLSAMLLASLTNNAVLAPFAVILGLFV